MFFHKNLVQEIKIKTLTRGDFTLASGIKSDYYIDLSKVVFGGRGFGLITDCIIHSICLNNINKIGGPAIGAIPIVVGLMCRCDMEGFIVRKQEKEYGKKDVIEGCLDKGDNVILVEDVTTSGNSLLKAVKVVQEFGCNVKQVVSVLDRNQGATELFEKENIPFKYLVSIDEVL
jgi:orotate phosphoribosyltransferase